MILGSAYYGFGALGSALQAYSDASNGDPAEAAIDSTEALGNFPKAIKPLVPQLVEQYPQLLDFIPGAAGDAAGATLGAAGTSDAVADLIAEGAAEAIGAWGSGIGLVALGSELIYDGIESALDSNAYEADSTKFLQQSDLGLNPDILVSVQRVLESYESPVIHQNAGSSSAPLRGSIAAEGSPRIGRISTERRSRSCASPQSASCSENYAIRPEVSGRTLGRTLIAGLVGLPTGSRHMRALMI
jgi:hypothetical protein